MPRSDFGQRLLVVSAACLAVSVAAWFWTYGLTYVDRAFLGNANFGYRPDPDGTREFLRELERPTFRQAGADVIAGAKGVDTSRGGGGQGALLACASSSEVSWSRWAVRSTASFH